MNNQTERVLSLEAVGRLFNISVEKIKEDLYNNELGEMMFSHGLTDPDRIVLILTENVTNNWLNCLFLHYDFLINDDLYDQLFDIWESGELYNCFLCHCTINN